MRGWPCEKSDRRCKLGGSVKQGGGIAGRLKQGQAVYEAGYARSQISEIGGLQREIGPSGRCRGRHRLAAQGKPGPLGRASRTRGN
ncbi:hypothetical protein GC101_11760 [Paenibacillus sp. LMG 31459]|uniref:Uncharacterized protein n=1 Tax=Paenibacillus phytohabitans TaxID=2654978 RepID=A0ABX1YHB6_9BACL|nr:hypothetical protein [Paenibacillus phytohabitans]NOU79551.1 hypothetical protein [Paenibacillus phytohabitans]